MKPTRSVVMTPEVQLWLSEMESKYNCAAEVCCWIEPLSGGGHALRVLARARFPDRGVLESREVAVEELYYPAHPIELGAAFLRQAVRLSVALSLDPQAKFWSRQVGM